MAIPEISLISDFKAGVKCLQNPSIIARSLSLSGIEKVPQVYSFCKWGAVIIALFATFSGLINSIKLLVIRIRDVKSFASSSTDLLRQHFIDDDDDFSEDDDSASVTTSEDGDFESTSMFDNPASYSQLADDDFRVAGSRSCLGSRWQNGNFNLRRRLSGVGDRVSWSDFAGGKSVVKLWDSLGLNLNLKDASESVLSLWDLGYYQKVGDFGGGRPLIQRVVAAASPSVLLSAGVDDSDAFVLGTYDSRMNEKTPAIHAEWSPSPPLGKKALRIGSSGVEKVYLRDGVTGALTVADLRNVKTPLENAAELADGDTWWDADAVIVENDHMI